MFIYITGIYIIRDKDYPWFSVKYRTVFKRTEDFANYSITGPTILKSDQSAQEPF